MCLCFLLRIARISTIGTMISKKKDGLGQHREVERRTPFEDDLEPSVDKCSKSKRFLLKGTLQPILGSFGCQRHGDSVPKCGQNELGILDAVTSYCRYAVIKILKFQLRVTVTVTVFTLPLTDTTQVGSIHYACCQIGLNKAFSFSYRYSLEIISLC